MYNIEFYILGTIYIVLSSSWVQNSLHKLGLSTKLLPSNLR